MAGTALVTASAGMRQRTRDLLKRGDTLFAKRYPIMSLWQQMAENFHIMRADFTRVRYLSEEFASYLMTGRPAMAHRDLANALPALMRPRDRQWMWARTHDKRINEDREARAYLDWLSEQQFRSMYDPRSGIVRACKEVDGDWAAFGNGVMTVEVNEWLDGLLIRSCHLRDVAWTEGHDLKINQVHEKRKITVRDLCRLWPKTVSKEIERVKDDEPDREVNCRRIVVPIDDYDLAIKNRKRTPFVACTIDVENDTLLEEKPVRSLGYVIPRWATVSGSQYAYSPACVYGLPDARMLQQITLTMLEASQKATDPPMIAVQEAVNGGVNVGAGMITWTDADYDERTGDVLRPMEMRFDGIRYGAAREERIEGLLDASFLLNQIRMPQITKDMTAYEASKVYEEFQRSSLPLLEPVEIEYNAALCSACFEVSASIGTFGSPYEMPEILSGQDLRWEFDTPMKAAIEQKKVFTFAQVTDLAAKAAQIDPTVLLNTDWDKAYREAQIGTGGADWLRDTRIVQKDKQQRTQQAQAAQTANALATGADVATKVATAGESAARARQAMVESGVM